MSNILNTSMHILIAAAMASSATSAFAQSVPVTRPSLDQLEATNSALQSKVQTLETRLSAVEAKEQENNADTTAAIQAGSSGR